MQIEFIFLLKRTGHLDFVLLFKRKLRSYMVEFVYDDVLFVKFGELHVIDY